MTDDTDLLCVFCNKRFTKASSHKRHFYYCRSKVHGEPKSRKRSCKGCVRPKIRCDATLPSCSACLIRNNACEYDGKALSNVQTNTSQTCQLESFTDTSTGFSISTYNDASELFNDMGLVPTMAAEPLFNFDLFDSSHLDKSSPQFPALGIGSSFGAQESDSSHTGQINLNSVTWRNPPDITLRTQRSPQAQMTSTLLIQIITSIPRKMIRKETFPPFIHPECYARNELGEMTETLTNCMVLAQMFVDRTKESRSILWRAVRVEQERLYLQYERFSDYELLAASQALLVYTIMQYVDGERSLEQNQFERPLLQSLNAVSSHLTISLGGSPFKDAILHDQEDWRNWIFMESRRRITTIARIMNMVLNIDHAINCEPLDGFALVPLPAKKTLWEAANAMQWRAEFEAESLARELFGLTTKGQLVKLRQRNGGIETEEAAWEMWYAGADAFGAVIMLVGQLLV